MGITFSDITKNTDKLSELLNEPHQNNRHDIWLWLHLNYDHDAKLPYESCNSETMRSEIAWFLKPERSLIDSIPSERARLLLPEIYLHWIGYDARQHEWLRPKIRKMTGRHLSRRLVHLTGRDRLIAMIDHWDKDVADKANEVEELRDDWLRHISKDSEFEWFADKKESTKRCVCAWEWLERNYLRPRSLQTPISNYQELLIFFDHEDISRSERAVMIREIKRRWNRKQFDERTADKKQVNVMLSKSVITQLDELAKKHGLKRAQIIERLVKMEADAGVYLSDK
ncbi:hypothetical protein [Pseudomonas sp. TTU2014-080ASC]|uniref:hypothetical protein n=1 Tax=Pseudomonas sp. TTU2014-080ASC TaxID=1729724 RepID=UPI000718AB01|nr:hypothetical protein [Pseudomonas sp. TTU2014-080ASC]KRW58564.1 hypothetical protein AO726_17145 [Pseudomonas sp. TTU2014-080ASC]